MSCRPTLRDVPQQTQSDTSGATRHFLPNGEPRPADVEMARVLKTAPVSMASDPASGAIAHWKHGALHDVVEPMADHVIMTYPIGVQATGAPQRKISCDWNGAYRSRDHHSGRLKRPLGHSRARQRRSALPSPQDARARCW